MAGIEFGGKGKEAGARRLSTYEAIEKIKDVLEDSYMNMSHYGIYRKFWEFIKEIEKEL